MVKNELRNYDGGDELNTNISVSDYIPCALARLDAWVNMIKNTQDIKIIDSGFLQNPINELLFRNATDDEAEMFIREISKRVQILKPFCVYLHRSNAKESISFAQRAKGKEWTNRVQTLLKETGHENHFERRFILENKLLSSNLLDWADCFVSDNDWSLAKEKIQSKLIDRLN